MKHRSRRRFPAVTRFLLWRAVRSPRAYAELLVCLRFPPVARVQVQDWSWRQWRCWELTVEQQQRLSRCVDRDLHGHRSTDELEMLAVRYPLRFDMEAPGGQSSHKTGRTTSSRVSTA